MNIIKAQKNIDKLSSLELKRCIQQIKCEIETYMIISENYSKEKRLNCSEPYLNTKYGLLFQFENKLSIS